MATQRASTPPTSSLEDVKNIIHCILCSNKEAVSPEELRKDYVTLCASALPFRELGFSSIENLLKAIPDVVELSFANGSLLAKAVPKNASAHISKLVAGQKKAKRTVKFQRPLNNNVRQLYQPPFKGRATQFNVANNVRHAPWNNNVMALPPFRRVEAPVHVFKAMQPAVQPQQQQAAQHPKSIVSSAAPPQPAKPAVNITLPAHEFRPMQPAQTNTQQPQQVKPPASLPPKPSLQKSVVVQPGPVSPALEQLSYSPTSSKDQQAKPSVLPESSRSKLARFVKLHQLGEITYESSRMKRGQYVATVAFSNSNIKGSCYPDNFPKEEDAFEKAAQDALDSLEDWYERTVTSLPVTTNKDVLAKRVVDMVGKVPSGCWSAAFPKVYIDEYREKLPKDWIQQVQAATDLLDFEPAKPTEHFIITLSRPKTPSPVPPVAEASVSEVSQTPAGTIPLAIPAQHTGCDIWTVHVISILTGSQVGVRRIDCEEYTEWDNLMNDLELHYGQKQHQLAPVPRESLKKGTLYVTSVDKMWFRIELIAFIDEDKATVSLVDFVDTEEVFLKDIYPLEARYGQLPHQGIVCQLHGLTAFSSSDIAVEAVSMRLVNNNFTAQITGRDPQITVVLSDCSNGKEQNLNELILEQCAEKAEAIPLKLGAVARSSVISYVSPRCDVFLLRDTPQQNAVDALVSMVALRVDNSPAAYNLIDGKIYLGKSEKHGWCRMRLLCSVPTAEAKVMVQLIDFGDTEAVSSSSLRDLQALSPVLARIPGQAVKVILARVPPPGKAFNDRAVEVLRNIIPADVNVLVRVVNNDDHPVVELFERLGGGKIVTINGSLEMDDSIYKAIENTPARESARGSSIPRSDLSHRMGNLTLSSRQSLTGSPSLTIDSEEVSVAVPQAEIPPVDKDRAGKPYEVHVLNVSNPHHFYVQSTLTSQALSALTRRMQELCVKENTSTLESNSVVVGGFYATMHAKSKSYRRVQVIRKLGSDCQVVFVDYGDMDVVAANSLKLLHKELAELPVQAIRAKLHGVKPNDGDWSPLDAFFFQKAAADKVLSSYVMDVLPDDTIVLKLIQSVEGQDLSIANLLIENSHATSA